MRRRGGIGRRSALLAAMTLLASGCGQDTPPAGSPPPAVAPGLGDGGTPPPVFGEPLLDDPLALERVDGPDRLVVITDNSPLVDTTTPAPTTPAADPGPPLIAPPSIVTDGTVTVRYLDGTERYIVVPSGSLLAVPAISWVERSLLDEPDVLMLVADPTGAIGPRGGRYARSETELVQYDCDPCVSEDDTGSDRTTTSTIIGAPTTVAPSDEEIAAAIEELPGIVEVVVRSAGVLGVAATSTTAMGRIIALEGVASVVPDVQLAPAHRPGEHPR